MDLILSSDLCAIHFDADTGALLGIRDIERKASFLDSGKVPQQAFRLFGLAVPSLGEVRLSEARRIPSAWGESIRLVFEIDGILVLLGVSIGFRSAQSSWSLQVRNCGRAPRSITVEFPRIAGIGASLFDAGAGWPAQWIAAADPPGQAGLGLIVRDKKAAPKTLLAEGGTVLVRYDSPFLVAPGRSIRLAETTVLASGPEWRSTARLHGAWQGALRGARCRVKSRARSRAAHPTIFPVGTLPAESLLALRISFPRLRLQSSNPVDASMAGIACRPAAEPEDGAALVRNWACAHASAAEALDGGEVRDDPLVDDPGIETRMFHGPHMDAIVAARLEGRSGERRGAGLADFHAPFEIRIPVSGRDIPEIAVCDLEDLSWSRHVPIVRDGSFVVGTSSNWLLCLVLGKKRRIVGFDPPAEVAPGGLVVIRVDALAGTGRPKRILFTAPRLLSTVPVAIGGEIAVPVPLECKGGFYPLSLRGKNCAAFTRFLHVLG